MTTHKMSIDSEYVPDWGVQEALRELFQNAIDHGDWTYRLRAGELQLISKNVVLEKRSLLIGHSRKPDGSIGKHGEGYKLAMLVLLRLGYGCAIRTGYEVWKPRLINSRTYKAKQLVFDCVKNHDPMNETNTVFYVQGLTDEDLQTLYSRNLHLVPTPIFHVSELGEILSEDQAGHLYVGGLWVCYQKGLRHGYNFSPRAISLDRDRRLLRDFDVQWLTSQMWVRAEGREEHAAKLIKAEAPDVQYLDSHMYRDRTIADHVAEEFVEEHGEDAVPVHDHATTTLAKMQGHTNIVVVPKTVHTIIRSSNTWTPPPARVVRLTPKDTLVKFFLKWKDSMSYEMEKEFEFVLKEADSWS